MKRVKDKLRRRSRRRLRVRKKIFGTADRPRISIYKSNRNTYVQVVDDSKGVTIAAASNLEKELHEIKNNVKDIEKLGEIVGERLKKQKIDRAVFDRNGYLYHGLVKAVANGIRKSGILF